ncbi:hypothetical protein NDU88_008149 [Pleurodeles waltl]|uniref:Uncharacterized protein n=1 Tax=Pleurodeles waltl TaxID=8319 RepID=A0AAV7NX03_PLEWA|nr:hypothetical protein NDU88_008149 [Pleurodeles waltl]
MSSGPTPDTAPPQPRPRTTPQQVQANALRTRLNRRGPTRAPTRALVLRPVVATLQSRPPPTVGRWLRSLRPREQSQCQQARPARTLNEPVFSGDPLKSATSTGGPVTSTRPPPCHRFQHLILGRIMTYN